MGKDPARCLGLSFPFHNAGGVTVWEVRSRGSAFRVSGGMRRCQKLMLSVCAQHVFGQAVFARLSVLIICWVFDSAGSGCICVGKLALWHGARVVRFGMHARGEGNAFCFTGGLICALDLWEVCRQTT